MPSGERERELSDLQEITSSKKNEVLQESLCLLQAVDKLGGNSFANSRSNTDG
ncbi:MAG: hypothetical protein PHO74_02140 [Weeksellaceae bacterium]|nr:hypothetical protein [Weeksellaceae bacterium]